MVNGLADALLCDALECADLAQDCSQAVLNLSDHAQKLVNAQSLTKLTVKCTLLSTMQICAQASTSASSQLSTRLLPEHADALQPQDIFYNIL